jgi:hypothetical protein
VTETVVGIVAHPDDEIGMVGTLKNHANRGDTVILAWMTAGESTTALKGTPEKKGEIRKKQAEEVSSVLGVKTRFLGFKDSQIPHTVEAAKKVAEFIREVSPTGCVNLCAISQPITSIPGFCQFIPVLQSRIDTPSGLRGRFTAKRHFRKNCGYLLQDVWELACHRMEIHQFAILR